ncbi:hypothetical protein Asppvi_010355 [Aspergillus pseudoviridinutans]|uniref:Fungal N-terminal domain-containing protein n=1 Tax=Aspergillus pseudoviridinutans TaxID=1517512 RepID=A0A9P3F005_9EURO|nr:uncharacterized protein Asppvi_010355 [Aspergillus pseudoviridinutans]GIJ91390.1 hypothetical protein Asppvi_010355 [Aspergillus pseudoviridinutans]
MSDPLSVVGSAAGIISLGIQVIDNIIIYCDSWKSYDKDIRDLAHKASGLSKTLKHLEDVLQGRQNFDSLSQKQIEDLMTASKVTIEKLKEMTGKIPFPSGGSKSAFAKRALYPLRKHTLVDAARMLDSLQANINTALSVLQVAPSLLRAVQDENCYAEAALKGDRTMCQSTFAQNVQRSPATAANHSPVCVCQNLRNQSQVLKKKLQLCSRFLSFSITLTLSITKGAGGCSISPTLTYQGITPYGFKELMYAYFRDTRKGEGTYSECCHYLIQNKLVRPSDIEADGSTMLDVRFSHGT